MDPSSAPETLLVTRPWLRFREVRWALLMAAAGALANALGRWIGSSEPIRPRELLIGGCFGALVAFASSFRSRLQIFLDREGLIIRRSSWAPPTLLPPQRLRLRSGQREEEAHWIQFLKGELVEAEITGLSSAEAERILDRVRSEFHLEIYRHGDGTFTYATPEQQSAQKAAYAPADLRCSLCQE